jgi:hypothetical protein
MSGLPPETKLALRDLAQLLVDEFRPLDMATFWGVKPWATRAYVWAVFTGRDPVVTLCLKGMGADCGAYDEDPTWLDETRRHRSRTYRFVKLVEALDATLARLGRTIPQAVAS